MGCGSMSEIDKIVNIIRTALPAYTVDVNGSSLAPAITVLYDATANTANTKDIVYSLIVRATSDDNRKTAVDTLLSLDALNPDGYYNGYVSEAVVTEYNMAIGYTAAIIEGIWTVQSEQKSGVTSGGLSYLYFFAPYQETIGLDNLASITLTLQLLTALTGATVYLSSYTTPTTIQDFYNYPYENLVANALHWTKIMNTTTPTLELSGDDDASLSLEDFFSQPAAFYSVFIYKEADDITSIPAFPDFIVETTTTTIAVANYPTYVEMKYADQPESENEFEAMLKLLARWTL
jgi:hypothetical protein